MEEIQHQELLYVESIQRTQFSEFTEAWDVYMSEYEANAFHSIDRLRQDQLSELNAFREGYPQAAERYRPSKQLLDMTLMERKSFGVKLYDRATEYVRIAEQMEVQERDHHYQKIIV
jgi:hypothetical protein